MKIDVRVIEDHADFLSLRSAWNELVTIASSPLYESWSWINAAWGAADGEARPCLIVASQGERLLAIAPLKRRTVKYYRVPFTEVSFLGDGFSDRNQFICDPAHPEALSEIWRFLAANPCRAELLRLEQIPESCSFLQVGRETLRRLEVEPASVVLSMPLHGTWEQYFERIQWELRRDLRKSERRMAEIGQWTVRHIHGAEIADFLKDIGSLEMAGYKSGEGKAFFADPRNAEFIRRYLETAPSDSPVLTVLEIDGRLIAYIIGFVHGHTFYAYNTSYDEGLRKAGPGKYVYSRAIRYAFQRQLGVLDFARGTSLIKERFGGEANTNVRAVYFYPSIKGFVVRQAVFRLRPWLKRVAGKSGRT